MKYSLTRRGTIASYIATLADPTATSRVLFPVFTIRREKCTVLTMGHTPLFHGHMTQLTTLLWIIQYCIIYASSCACRLLRQTRSCIPCPSILVVLLSISIDLVSRTTWSCHPLALYHILPIPSKQRYREHGRGAVDLPPQRRSVLLYVQSTITVVLITSDITAILTPATGIKI